MRKGRMALVLLLTGCVSHGGGIRPLRPLEVATAPYQEAVTASLTGSLMYEGGCLLFRNDEGGAPLMPVWPTGSVFNGTSVIFHQPGKIDQPVLVAEEFVMEGQPLPWTALPGPAYSPFQRQCAAQPFMVARVRPAN